MDSTERKVMLIKLLTVLMLISLVVGIIVLYYHITGILVDTPSIEQVTETQTPVQEQTPAQDQAPAQAGVTWSALFKILSLICILVAAFIAVRNYIKNKRIEKQEELKIQEKQLQDFLSSTHKTFAEQELEELKQKYKDTDVSQDKGLSANNEESQVISLDVCIENGKITSIKETNSKAEKLNKAFKEMTM